MHQHLGSEPLRHTFLSRVASRRINGAVATLGDGLSRFVLQQNAIGRAVLSAPNPLALNSQLTRYVRDRAMRNVAFADVLRRWSDQHIAHNAAGAPPVLAYPYTVVMDGADLPTPSNYVLLHIQPPDETTTWPGKRPYIIIDPRAGHGPGIGGFKPDSQVGVALADGHPVYVVAFRQMPEPGQTIASVTHTEAAFVREVERLHPDSPKPVIIGNCQGGWATAILAATHLDLIGPIVLNGAPMSYWGGKLGQDPMRYAGGLSGGTFPAAFSSDLNGGVFDGANLVQNFEAQNPGRTWFRKYYDLYRASDRNAAHRFLEFERWWGAFFMMTEAEIVWILENLFIGNRLSQNQAQLEPGVPIDLKAIRAPIICFASHGDNITPPAQALNWILDIFADETEIETRGQRIVYMVHPDVGHLGIFVSSSVAKREHTQMASTLKTIEALPPGLFEMQIETVAGHGIEKNFVVSFAPRRFEDIEAVTGLRRDEQCFAAVARLSEATMELYDSTARPLIRTLGAGPRGRMVRRMHPMRNMRQAWASDKPLGQAALWSTQLLPQEQTEIEPDNPFVLAEALWADMVETSWNLVRDWREAATELAFFAIWAHPVMLSYGAARYQPRTLPREDELARSPMVERALASVHEGGLAAGIVRLLLLLAATRKDVRKDRLERSSAVLNTQTPFAEMEPADRLNLIHQQKMIIHFDQDAAINTLQDLICTAEDRKRAEDALRFVLGSEDEMSEGTKTAWHQIQAWLREDSSQVISDQIRTAQNNS
ncbi:DUF3141 domain-containing protein [Thalassococcus sp. S3]|uniref:DUF3141 domain-containing protein n=1 Tax=Thalassococcus sp. S3 TaxID=2017482 RepID=UPI001024626A|nr:DUF3141 domain-containing protein [Thalassococcus sp. S3]QBF33229.1 alpha/beta hydrolase [Thalassococcus sp. S3]